MSRDEGLDPPKKTASVPEAVPSGQRVRALRLALGLTQEQLAEAADLNVIQLSNIERGATEPKLRTIVRLAEALNVSVGKLVGE